jgi:hypothetical protein
MIVFRLKWHLQVYLNNQSYGANVYINTNYKKNPMQFDTAHMETRGKYLLQLTIINH